MSHAGRHRGDPDPGTGGPPSVGEQGFGLPVPYPYFGGGAVGGITHFHLNELYDRIQNGDQRRLADRPGPAELPDGKGERLDNIYQTWFTVRINGADTPDAFNEGVPLGIKLAWRERGLSAPSAINVGNLPLEEELARKSDLAPDPLDQFGIFLIPPYGLMLSARRKEGGKGYIYLPAPTLVHVRCVAVNPGPGELPATYDVQTDDEAIVQFGLTPTDRWQEEDGTEVKYQDRPIDSSMILHIRIDPLTGNTGFELWAFEHPKFVQCPQPFAGTGGLVDAESWLGI